MKIRSPVTCTLNYTYVLTVHLHHSLTYRTVLFDINFVSTSNKSCCHIKFKTSLSRSILSWLFVIDHLPIQTARYISFILIKTYTNYYNTIVFGQTVFWTHCCFVVIFVRKIYIYNMTKKIDPVGSYNRIHPMREPTFDVNLLWHSIIFRKKIVICDYVITASSGSLDFPFLSSVLCAVFRELLNCRS